jgi:hypothetical protein
MQMTRSLDGVGVEQNTSFLAKCADLLDGLDRSDFIVGVHDGHQRGVFADGLLQVFQTDDPFFVHGEKLDAEALLSQLVQRVKDGVVLEGGGYDVLLAFFFSAARQKAAPGCPLRFRRR